MPWWTITFWTMLGTAASYAFKRGGGAERAAAAMLVLAAVGTVLVRSTVATRYSNVESGVVAVDVVLLVGLVVVAVRSGRAWSVALAVLQSVTLLGHLGKRLDPDLWRLGYAMMITGPAYPGLVALAIGTFRHRRRSAETSRTVSSWRFWNTRRESTPSGQLDD